MAARIQNNTFYGWHRFWIGLDDRDGVAARGLFSPDLHAMGSATGRPAARTLRAMEDVRVLLLRGESGAGKTVALAQEAERLRAAGRPVELADLSDGLCDLPSILEEKGDRRDLTILVDGLDIALSRDGTLDPKLRRMVPLLARHDGCRLRFALRTGFAAEPFAACLAKHFKRRFEHLTLAPLRSDDVRTAAMHEGIDPGPFFSELEGLQVAALAARPPTLRMLLRLWKEENRLPSRRQDLYRLGCEALLREANEIRLNAGGGHDLDYAGRLELSERFAIATRLAALMTFGDHDYLDLGSEVDGVGLHVDAVAGGVEPAGGLTRVTRSGIREVVGSALFRPAGPDGFAFAHPSFMRYLAAYFVSVRKLPPEQGLSLLSASDGRIGANRIEAASWLGALEPAYFDHLAAVDPQILLRAAIPPAAKGEQRLGLARSLLELSAGDSLDLEELSATGDLVLVACKGLDQLLAGILGDKAEPLKRRLFAARIAKDTGCVPAAASVATARDETESSDLRCAVIDALGQGQLVAQAAPAILELSVLEEPDEDVRMAALRLAMRSLLSPADVIRRLKPGRRGGGQTILCLRLLREITPAALPEALHAITAIAIRSDEREVYEDHLMVAQELAARAFEHLQDPGVLDALTAFIATFPPREPWLRWSYTLHKRGLPPTVGHERRRDLVSAVVAYAPASLATARNLLEGSFLLHDHDLSWIAKEACSALSGPYAAVWATVAQEVERGRGGPPFRHLLAEGVPDDELPRLAELSLQLPRDYERWSPPSSWDPAVGMFAHDLEVEDGEERDDEDERDVESIFRVLDDHRLLTVQTKAGGRRSAPAVDPDTLLALTDRADRRLVHDSRDLLRVVRESLGRLQLRLKGHDPLVRALWDEGDSPRPKDENFLSDFIVDHLRTDLIGRGVVADREVQIRARLQGTPGERTDIFVQALSAFKNGTSSQKVARLTIEVKGCWHRELHSAMETQLVTRYLKSREDAAGLYLVGWYVCPAWSAARVAGGPSTGIELAGLRTDLTRQADGLSERGRCVEAVVIDATLA